VTRTSTRTAARSHLSAPRTARLRAATRRYPELPGWPVSTDRSKSTRSAPRAFRRGLRADTARGVLVSAQWGPRRDGWLEVVVAAWKAVYAGRRGHYSTAFRPPHCRQYSTARGLSAIPARREGPGPGPSCTADRNNRLARGNHRRRSPSGNLDGSPDGPLESWLEQPTATSTPGHTEVSRFPVAGHASGSREGRKCRPRNQRGDTRRRCAREIGTKIVAAPSLGDLDGDGRIEVVSTVNEEYREEPKAVFANLFVNLYMAAGVLAPGIHARLCRHATESSLRRHMERG